MHHVGETNKSDFGYTILSIFFSFLHSLEQNRFFLAAKYARKSQKTVEKSFPDNRTTVGKPLLLLAPGKLFLTVLGNR